MGVNPPNEQEQDPEQHETGAEHPAIRPEPPAPDDLIVVDQSTGQQLGPVTQFEYWRSGPLPSAGELADYNTVVPGLAERIVQRWETETDHRRDIERMIVTAGVALQRNGQRIAATIGLIAIVGGIVLTAIGKDAVGLASILTPIGLIAAFIGEIRQR